jgi:hypothetical protein
VHFLKLALEPSSHGLESIYAFSVCEHYFTGDIISNCISINIPADIYLINILFTNNRTVLCVYYFIQEVNHYIIYNRTALWNFAVYVQILKS